MRWLRIFSRTKRENDLDREIRAHLELEAEAQQEAGRPAEDARYGARRAFGNPTLVKEDVRASWGWASLKFEAWLQDLRYGLRLLRRNPAFTLFSVASLGLGIGATVAVFSLFDAIVLRAASGARSRAAGGRLVRRDRPGRAALQLLDCPIRSSCRCATVIRRSTVSSRRTRSAGSRHASRRAGHRRGPVRDGRLLRSSRHPPVAGTSADRRRTIAWANPVAVVNHAYWQRRFGGRPDVLGAAIALNNVAFTIVGVEPRGFFGTEVGRPSDISIPMRTRDLLVEQDPLWNDASATWIYVMGRLKPGVPLDRAQQELDAIFRQATLTAHVRRPRNAAPGIEPQAGVRAARGPPAIYGDTYARWLRLLLSLARCGPAAREPERRHAVAVPIRGKAAGDRDTPRARRGAGGGSSGSSSPSRCCSPRSPAQRVSCCPGGAAGRSFGSGRRPRIDCL